MIIDFHTHVGDHRTPERMDQLPVSWEGLIERMDEEGIDKAVVLPSWVSPEILKAPFLFSPQVDILSRPIYLPTAASTPSAVIELLL